MKVWVKYYSVQLPGWGVVAVLLWAAHRWLGLPVWLALTVILVDVVKDFVLYPFLRPAYETNIRSGAEKLIGEQAEVRHSLRPEGYVWVAGERWRARCETSGHVVPAGALVRIVALDGLTLVVAEEPIRDIKPASD